LSANKPNSGFAFKHLLPGKGLYFLNIYLKVFVLGVDDIERVGLFDIHAIHVNLPYVPQVM